MRGAKGTEPDASSSGAGGATMFRKDVVKQMRKELAQVHQSLVHKQVNLLNSLSSGERRCVTRWCEGEAYPNVSKRPAYVTKETCL